MVKSEFSLQRREYVGNDRDGADDVPKRAVPEFLCQRLSDGHCKPRALALGLLGKFVVQDGEDATPPTYALKGGYFLLESGIGLGIYSSGPEDLDRGRFAVSVLGTPDLAVPTFVDEVLKGPASKSLACAKLCHAWIRRKQGSERPLSSCQQS